jgi:quinol monooxygenase YgiN
MVEAKQVIEALSTLAKHVKANEPDCVQYEVHQSTEGSDDDAPIIMIEQ